MSTWRYTTKEYCPLDETQVRMNVCDTCRYFRGASSANHEPRGWQINCNWPRDGAYVAPSEAQAAGSAEIPDVFLHGWDLDGRDGKA